MEGKGKMDNMTIEEEWIASIVSPRTKENYLRGWKLFRDYSGKTAEELLQLRKSEGRKRFETRIVMFFKHVIKEKKISENTARTYCIPIESFCSYFDLPLKLASKLPSLTMKIERYKPTLEDIQKVYKFGDFNVKAWLSLSRDIPARVNDLLRISKEPLTEEFLFKSGKEHTVGKCYVSSETIEIWERVTNMPQSQKGIYKMLQKACEVAGVHRINPHLLRKWWHTTATNLNLNDTIIKILEFKAVPKSILTYYLDREELRNSWKRVVEALPLEPKSGNGRVDNLMGAMDLVLKVLRKMVIKELKTEGYNQEGMLGIIRDYSRLTHREILEKFLEKEE